MDNVRFNKSGIIYASGENTRSETLTNENGVELVDESGNSLFVSKPSINDNLLLTEAAVYSPTAYLAYKINFPTNLVEGETYTIQFWDIDVSHTGKTENALGIDVYWGGGSLRMKYWHGTDYFTNGHADYLVGTFTVTSAQASHNTAVNQWFNIYNSVGNADGTRNMHIGAWKLEYGDTPTAWCMNPNDWGYVGNNHGFIETGDKMSVYKSHIQTTEFIEW